MLKFIPLILLFIIGCSSNEKKELKIGKATPELQRHLNNFVDSEWGNVAKAKDSLMIIEKDAIPHLIGLMRDEKRFVKLKNTADLIYPGATEYYGHGWFIPYDLDWIAIRAGWALEELTFQNFGFIENSITDIDFIQLHKDNYEEYIETGKQDVDFKRESFKKSGQSVENAKNWWIENKDEWTNLKAIKDALYSNDVGRQMDALQHLRYPNYESKGLTEEYYVKELKPRVEELYLSENEDISEQARMKLNIWRD